MTAQSNRPNLLLIEDFPEMAGHLREELKAAHLECRLHIVGAGTTALSYLRRTKPYGDAPVPDLILFDFSEPKTRFFKLLDELKSDPELSEKPLVLLTSDKSEEMLTKRYEEKDQCTIFSPVGLESFLQSMQSLDLRRFLHAIQLIEQLGHVLVRLPARLSGSQAENYRTASSCH